MSSCRACLSSGAFAGQALGILGLMVAPTWNALATNPLEAGSYGVMEVHAPGPVAASSEYGLLEVAQLVVELPSV